MDSETKRKLVHIGNGLWTLLLPFIPRLFAIALTIVALILCLGFFRPERPRPFRDIFSIMAREVDIERGFLIGPTIYIVMVTILMIFVDYRIAGAAFAILAFGDGFATIIGKKYGSINIYNEKTVEGSLAFFFFSFFFGSFVFILINTFQLDGTGDFVLLPFFIVTKELNLSMIFITLGITCFVLMFVEHFLGEYVNDNILIPCIAFVIQLFLLNVL